MLSLTSGPMQHTFVGSSADCSWSAARLGKRVLQYFRKAVSVIVALHLVPLLSAAETVYYSTRVSLLEQLWMSNKSVQVQTGCMIMFYPSADPLRPGMATCIVVYLQLLCQVMCKIKLVLLHLSEHVILLSLSIVA